MCTPRLVQAEVGGNVDADVERLSCIASVLEWPPDTARRSTATSSTERRGAGAVWRAVEAEPRLARLCASVLFVEQPVKRARALMRGGGARGSRRVMIDESDGDLDAFPREEIARRRVSKAWKGVWRSLINLARCRAWNAEAGRDRYSCPPRT